MQILFWVCLSSFLLLVSSVRSDEDRLFTSLQVRGRNVGERNHRGILEHLRGRFKNARNAPQYGVLYVPPPNTNSMILLPNDTNRGPEAPHVLYPPPPMDNTFEHNYAAASVDYYGLKYGRQYFGEQHHFRCERLFLDLVWPRLQLSTAYHNWYHGSRPPAVYLYTHFLPCPGCFTVIQNWVVNNNIPLTVGYQELTYGNQDLAEAKVRRDGIDRVLREHDGRLLRFGNCSERGKATEYDTWLPSRPSDERCPAFYGHRKFSIIMDFSSGKAAVTFAGIPGDYYGWVGLYTHSARATEMMTWEWTNGVEQGVIVFNNYIDEGLEVRYYRNEHYVGLAVTSARWNACEFGWIRMNNVPSNYGDVYMKLTVERGYPKISLHSNYYGVFDGYDYVAVQGLQQIGVQEYWTWAYVTSMTQVNSRVRYYWFGDRIGGYLVHGFRAKFIYHSNMYYWNDNYDNATPLWIPDQCRGTSI